MTKTAKELTKIKIAPSRNSYNFQFKCGPIFSQELSQAVTKQVNDLMLAWWDHPGISSTLKISPHLSIATCKPDTNFPLHTIVSENAKLGADVLQSFIKHVKHSIFLRPFDLHITDGGWIILKFEILSIKGESSDVLKTLLDDFIKIGKRYKLIFNEKHIDQHFTPHVSLGVVNCCTEMPEYIWDPKINKEKNHIAKNAFLNKHKQGVIQKAVQLARLELEKHKQTLLNAFKAVRLLNLYHAQLLYNPPVIEKQVLESQILFDKKLLPRDYAISHVEWCKDLALLKFLEATKATVCSNFLHKINIPTLTQSELAFAVSKANYERIVGMIKNCKPIAQLQETITFSAAASIVHKTPISTSPVGSGGAPAVNLITKEIDFGVVATRYYQSEVNGNSVLLKFSKISNAENCCSFLAQLKIRPHTPITCFKVDDIGVIFSENNYNKIVGLIKDCEAISVHMNKPKYINEAKSRVKDSINQENSTAALNTSTNSHVDGKKFTL